jgi:plasmid stabilization system protein ParE
MARITRRPQAAVDILDIWHYIAEDSLNQADRWVDKLDCTRWRAARNFAATAKIRSCVADPATNPATS